MTPASPDAFRLAMRRVAATVTVVTTGGADGSRVGVTATAVSSVSLDPPSLLVCVNRGASLHDALARRGAFCVNVLRDDQAGIARLFSSSGDRALRFSRGDWREGPLGLPYLAGSCASIFCQTAKLVEFGTHTVVIGAVLDALSAQGGRPLLYHDGDFLASVVE